MGCVRPSTARAGVLLVLLVAVLAPGVGAAAAPTTATAYDWPVPGAPVAAFALDDGPYGSGHRGVDLPAERGQPIHPMADGVVLWSGVVAGDAWATVSHADGIVTSYGPLLVPGALPVGTPVTRADVIGRARGDAHGHAGRLHVGARRDGRYVDPALLVEGSPELVATLVGPGEVAADRPGAPRRRLVLVPGTPPSPNRLVVLAGLTSRFGDVPFDLEALGYGPDAWEQFSYLGVDEQGQPVAYDHEATWGRVHDMALALRDQLRAHAAARPGQAVDLLGHSLGGLVGMYYLLVLHDPTDPTLPPIGNVMTVASPLEGTDSANAVALARQGPIGQALLDLVEAHHLTPPGADGPTMHDRIPVLDDLQTTSEVVEAVRDAWSRYQVDPWSSPLATGTDVLTIGSALDPVVNEHRSDLLGSDHRTILDPDLHTHSAITHDDRTEQLLLARLSGEPLPGGGAGQLLTDVGAEVGSGLVAALEYAIAGGIMALDGFL